MIDRQSLLAQLLMGPPQPATRLSQLASAPVDPVDAMRASLPPMATPDTRAGRPNRLAELTMPSAEFEPAVRPFGSPHVPAVTTPSEERRLVDLAMMLSSFVGNLRAFHGSPHRFDRFDMRKIGTGEGAQAYGHGLYFAENPATAQTYRAVGLPAYQGTTRMQAAHQLFQEMGGDRGKALKAAHERFRSASRPEDARLWQDVANNFDSLVTRPPGSMYEVNLRTTPNRLLDWDKPLSQQPEAVRNAAMESYGKNWRHWAEAGDPRAKTFERHFGDPMPEMFVPFSPDEAALWANRGIDGIQYLDQGSRATGDGTRNFVMFRDDIIDILRRYGLAAGLLGGSAATADAAP